MNCSCDTSDFLDKDHGHVVTGDINIVVNTELRSLFRKGPNYREPKFINWRKTEESLKEDIRTFIKKWSDKTGLAEVCFVEWKTNVFNKLDDKIKKLRKKSKYIKTESLIRKYSKELEELKSKYVMVPVDKAANNIGFVCKKYYLEVLRKEVESETYENDPDTIDDVIDYMRKCSANIGIAVGKPFKDLPLIHTTIKLHKNPVKFRFIIGSRTAIIKPAAKTLLQILKLVMMTHKRYCDKVSFYTGIERFWIAENNEKVLQNMEKINKRNAARNVKMFDFSTLYTNISQDDLKEKLKYVVDKAFKGGSNKYIRVNKDYARWNSSVSEGTYTKERIYLLIDCVVDNSYFRLGNRVYRQSIGIPMGVDPGPQMANLYLYYYESQYMEQLTKADYKKAKRFNNTSRFIDDLATLNNDGALAEDKHLIYPAELVLNEENENEEKGNFLDISVEIVNKKFITKTYDKRDDYKFEIVNYPDLSGNIPKRAAYGVYTSQIIRYAKVCSNKTDFDDRIKTLTGKLIKKGFEKDALKNTLLKCFKKHGWIKLKYE